MRVFVAGASGALGLPVVTELIRQGHEVTGMTRSDRGAALLEEFGAEVARVSALDADGVEAALRHSDAEAVIDQLTALPRTPKEMAAAAAQDRQVRLEGGGHLLAAARRLGVGRYLQQSSAFFLAPGEGLGDESTPLATGASPFVAASSRIYTELERRVLQPGPLVGVALRYGFFYGPNTWYWPDGACAEMAQRGELAIIGAGSAIWNFIHVEDAAVATCAALAASGGVYQVVDDSQMSVGEFLPAFCRWVGAPAPPRIDIEEARRTRGEDAVYYGTCLRAAANEKAKRVLGLRPRPQPWR